MRFRDDWFSANVPQWTKRLRHLRDTPCRLLEIGTHEGRATFWLADNVMTHQESRLVTLDKWVVNTNYGSSGREHFYANVAECKRRDQIAFVEGDSFESLKTLEPGFDFAYIDGSHEARDVMSDWVAVVRLMRSGALVCFDDYEWSGPEVQVLPKTAVDAALGMWCDRVEVVDRGYQMWVRIR